MRNADHVVTLTETAKDILLKTYFTHTGPEARDRFTVIPTCADFSHFDTARFSSSDRSALRERLGIPPDALVLGYVGTIHPDYVPESMFLAFQQLRRLEPRSM